MKKAKLFSCVFLFVVFLGTNTIAQDTWSQGTNMSIARSAHTVGTVNGKIYAISGNSYGAYVRTVEEYNPTTNNWITKADIPTERKDFSGCGINGKIYAIGGWHYFNTTFANNEEYNPATNTWTTKTPMPTARWGHATCAVNGKIYVIGGALGWPIDILYETIEVYDPSTDTWETKAPLPTPRWMLSCSVVNGKIYAIGGHDDQGTVKTMEVYDPDTDTWTTKSNMSTARWGLATAAVNEKIYAIGGADTYPPSFAYSTVEEYDPSTNTWTTKSNMPAGWIAIAACVVNDKIYIPGGGGTTSSETYAELYIYDPGETGIENESETLNFELHQNYPNPFNQTTTITYSLPRAEFVTLKVYNLVDNHEALILVNSFQRPGDHKVILTTEGFPSGIYYYRLQSGEFSETKKLLLLE